MIAVVEPRVDSVVMDLNKTKKERNKTKKNLMSLVSENNPKCRLF